jgi:hypothetical protein
MPARPRWRTALAVVFAVLALSGVVNATLILLYHERGYGTWPLGISAAAYGLSAAWCAVACWRRPGHLAGAVAAWATAVLGVLLAMALAYRPGARFWLTTAAGVAAVALAYGTRHRWRRGARAA